MSDLPPYPPNQPDEPGWGQQPPPPPGSGPPPGWEPPPGGAPGPQRYEATDAIGYGWKGFTTHTGPLLIAALIVLSIPLAVQIVGALITGGSTYQLQADGDGFDFDVNIGGIVINLLGSMVAMVLSAAMVRLALDVVDGGEVSVGRMFSRFDVVQVLIAAVLLGIATTIGLALCVLPGLVVIFLTFFTNYFIVGKGQDAITAIKSSVSLVTGNFGALILLALLGFLCMVGGILACCVGILVAYPVVTLAAAYSFRTLQGEPVRQL